MTRMAKTDPEREVRAARRGMGCLTLFALPFVAVGAFAAVELVRGLAGGNAASMPPGFAAIFAITFGGSGIGLIAAGRYGAKKAAAEAASRTEHPDAPWFWRDDWAQGRARSPQRASAVAMTVFAILWNAVSAPLLFVVPDEFANGNRAALVGLLFPVVGVGLLIAAVRLAIRGRKYRGTEVELGRVPIVPGAPFEGTLHARFPDGAPQQLALTLTCVRRRVTGSGKNRSTSERVLWQDEQKVEGWDIAVDFEGARVPFSFDIPDAAPSATPGSGDDRIIWRLDAHAETPGVDYAESFELPVFATTGAKHATPAHHDFDDLESRLAITDAATPPARPESPTILVRPADPTGLELISSPGRARMPVWPMLFFSVLWWGAVVFMVRVGAPVGFPIVFGLIGVVVVLGMIDVAFVTTRTHVTDHGVTVRRSAFGVGRTHMVAREDVRLVGVKVGMSQGQSATQSAKAWHDVVIRRDAGNPIAVARHIPTRAEAEWVAAELRQALGVG